MTQKQASNFQVGDSIELHRYALEGDGSRGRRSGSVRLDGEYSIVGLRSPEWDVDEAILVDIETPDGVKTVDFMPSQRA